MHPLPCLNPHCSSFVSYSVPALTLFIYTLPDSLTTTLNKLIPLELLHSHLAPFPLYGGNIHAPTINLKIKKINYTFEYSLKFRRNCQHRHPDTKGAGWQVRGRDGSWGGWKVKRAGKWGGLASEARPAGKWSGLASEAGWKVKRADKWKAGKWGELSEAGWQGRRAVKWSGLSSEAGWQLGVAAEINWREQSSQLTIQCFQQFDCGTPIHCNRTQPMLLLINYWTTIEGVSVADGPNPFVINGRQFMRHFLFFNYNSEVQLTERWTSNY